MQTPSNRGESLAERVSRRIAEGESYGVEFKGEGRAPLNDRDLVEAVVCLANGTGGLLLVGVEDDGTVTGARPRHEAGRTDPLRLQALIANSTQGSQHRRGGRLRVAPGGGLCLLRDGLSGSASERIGSPGLHATWRRARAVERGSVGDLEPRRLPSGHQGRQPARGATAPP